MTGWVFAMAHALKTSLSGGEEQTLQQLPTAEAEKAFGRREEEGREEELALDVRPAYQILD